MLQDDEDQTVPDHSEALEGCKDGIEIDVLHNNTICLKNDNPKCPKTMSICAEVLHPQMVNVYPIKQYYHYYQNGW